MLLFESSEAVESKLVKLETSRSEILPPIHLAIYRTILLTNSAAHLLTFLSLPSSLNWFLN